LAAALNMQMRGGQSLSKLLKPEEYNRIRDYFSAHQSMLPFWALEHMKPMLISSLIEEQSLGCSSIDGMELQIMKYMRGRDPQKPVRGLETAAFQLGLFDSIPYKKQAEELVDYIDSADENKKLTKQLADLYIRQDLDGIQALSDKDDPGMDEYMDLLLYGRNRKWARELDTLLLQRPLLVAVGAAHLPGPQGVIQLLKKEGFTVEPVLNK
ncbi:MAG TPA: TraB/GumN family protein, partial [Puia sp.]|nr:TraB/GumN family protein [Puia sp.]